ncbi:holo-ACP synthase [Clostridium sp. BJN0001]|uniref:holo-ACP synthase n=1 Tax=Clostridium sp. BJN0001 TaxID=2930219 RepID=UPI001FD534DC|nr:holo-ACP synthase [Clostridium sp. BJN0001]
MIFGVGTDIVEIKRIESSVNKNNNFITRFFTEAEVEYFKSKRMKANVIAGNFAAKEAISKAIGTGFRGFFLKDIEVLRDNLGKPFANVSDKLKRIIGEKDFKLHVSISHSMENATAFAVLEVFSE